MSANTRILGTPLSVAAAGEDFQLVDRLPDSIDCYSIVKAIGQGGMGCVFEVCHSGLGKSFALKLLSDSLRNNVEANDRFRAETLALGKLDHPNIVSAMDAGVWQGRPYLVTELLRGCDLATTVSENGKLDIERVVSIALQLAEALSFAHSQGFYHRDIKPSNVFFQNDGTAKLLDFGLVRCESNTSMTRTGCFMGTVDFVAPEQASNASEAGAASDIYSLGCTLIFLLSGEVPFPNRDFSSLTAKLQAHLHTTPAWLNRPPAAVPKWLVKLVAAMVAKNPKDRPVSCQSIATSLKTRHYPVGQENSPTSMKFGSMQPARKWAIGVSCIGVSFIASLGYFGWNLLGAGQTAGRSKSAITTSTTSVQSAASGDSTNGDTMKRASDASSFQPQSHTTERTSMVGGEPKITQENTLPVSQTKNARNFGLDIQQLRHTTKPPISYSKGSNNE